MTCAKALLQQVAASPVHLQHEVRWEVGYPAEALGLGLVAGSSAEVVRHDFLARPLGQASCEGHLGQHHLIIAILLHMSKPDALAADTTCL